MYLGSTNSSRKRSRRRQGQSKEDTSDERQDSVETEQDYKQLHEQAESFHVSDNKAIYDDDVHYNNRKRRQSENTGPIQGATVNYNVDSDRTDSDRTDVEIDSHEPSHGRHGSGGHVRGSKPKYAFMVASPDMSDTDYFTDLVYKYQRSKNKSSADALELVHDVTRQLAEVYKIHRSRLPLPEKVILKDWTTSPGGAGWHIWKRDVNWSRVSHKIRNLKPPEPIYVVGADYCGGQCQLWAEGALQTVEEVLDRSLTKEELRTPHKLHW